MGEQEILFLFAGFVEQIVQVQTCGNQQNCQKNPRPMDEYESDERQKEQKQNQGSQHTIQDELKHIFDVGLGLGQRSTLVGLFVLVNVWRRRREWSGLMAVGIPGGLLCMWALLWSGE